MLYKNNLGKILAFLHPCYGPVTEKTLKYNPIYKKCTFKQKHTGAGRPYGRQFRPTPVCYPNCLFGLPLQQYPPLPQSRPAPTSISPVRDS